VQSLNQYFSTQSGGLEIISDIESRIAELFREKINDQQESVTSEWVDEVIHKMGKPEDFIGEEENQGYEFKGGKVKKRLYRDTENRVLGGVCSGLSAYLNIDPVILRILFILLVFAGAGISVIIYLILWVVVPKATTTAQRLEMRGEEPTITNIQKTIQEEVKEVKKSFSRFNKSETYQKGKNVANKAGQAISRLFRSAGRLAGILLGALLILFGFISLVILFISLALGSPIFDEGRGIHQASVDLPSFLGFFINPGLVTVSILLFVLLIGIPLLAIFFVGTKMVFRYKTNNKVIGLGALGIWLVALISGIAILVGQINNFSIENTATTSTIIDCKSCKTLYIELANAHDNMDMDDNLHFNDFIISPVNGKDILAGRPHLNLESTDGNEFVVNIKRRARGSNRDEIQESIKQIQYDIKSQDSILVLSPYFTLSDNARWRDQKVQVTVKVPKGKKIQLGPNVDQLPFDFDSTDYPWERERTGQTMMSQSDTLAMNK
jgi:phage shock protein PspC (stress-responsive transcriptional regulator)/predicted Zn-ribbon and HTH transcriptional regulator